MSQSNILEKSLQQIEKKYPYSLLPDVSDPFKYSDFRCVDPVAVETTTPWYPNQNICPCNPNLSNPTGRGFTPCPFGVQFDQNKINNSVNNIQPLMSVNGVNTSSGFQSYPSPVTEQSVQGLLIPGKQFVAPQAQPRPLAKIGLEWRSAWA